ncbi:TIGR01212 family radical SAM protein [archaeon]|nr:TIGR01212 family radical SAM protein [archaeon]
MIKRQPYLTLNEFLRNRFGKRVQKISLDASLGCPNRDREGKGGCIYCNASGSGTGSLAGGLSLKEQIETQMEAMGRRYKAESFIAYFQSYSNTYADVATLKGIYDNILPYPGIVGLAIGTRPDCIDPQKLSLIDSYGEHLLVWIEYGLQSANDMTLERINRGHDVRAFIEAVNLTSRYDIRICAHVIIGLPGETREDHLATAALLSSLPVTDVKIHLLYVIKGTALETMYQNGEYKPLEMDAYADAVAMFIAHLRDDIVIQRVTGDPHAAELVAPAWSLEKTTVRDAVSRSLALKGLSQGSLHLHP